MINNGSLVFDIEEQDYKAAVIESMNTLGRFDLVPHEICMSLMTQQLLPLEARDCILGLPVVIIKSALPGLIYIHPDKMVFQFPNNEKILDEHGVRWVEAKGLEPEARDIMVDKYKEIAEWIERTPSNSILVQQDTAKEIEKIVLRGREVIKYTEEDKDLIYGPGLH